MEYYDAVHNEPTTFLCGHSCCLRHTTDMLICHICRSPLPDKLTVSISLRDGAIEMAAVLTRMAGMSATQAKAVEQPADPVEPVASVGTLGLDMLIPEQSSLGDDEPVTAVLNMAEFLGGLLADLEPLHDLPVVPEEDQVDEDNETKPLDDAELDDADDEIRIPDTVTPAYKKKRKPKKKKVKLAQLTTLEKLKQLLRP